MMRSKWLSFSVLVLVHSVAARAQGPRRLVIMEANGPLARANAVYAISENRVANDLTSKLVGTAGLAIIDRGSLDKILKEQNLQYSDRSSAETAVRIGKLLGAGQIVLVNVDDLSYTTHADTSGNKTTTTGTVLLRANARVIDVESGVIVSAPSSPFEDSVVVSEVSQSQGFMVGSIRVAPPKKSSGGDPKVIEDKEWAKAREAVAKDLATKLIASFAGAPGMGIAPGSTKDFPLVAGIANGSVYINQGTASGIKAGDKFSVVRQVSLGLIDPKTGQPMTHKQRVCVLTIADADESTSSGTCQGGIPQSKDIAEPFHQ